jgi:hypothetical protein
MEEIDVAAGVCRQPHKEIALRCRIQSACIEHNDWPHTQ